MIVCSLGSNGFSWLVIGNKIKYYILLEIILIVLKMIEMEGYYNCFIYDKVDLISGK